MLEQCCEKMKKLKAEYKKIKDKQNETGQGRYPEWNYFDCMDAVLDHKPATQLPVVVNSLEDGMACIKNPKMYLLIMMILHQCRHIIFFT